jgi:hypothetical protein
VQDAPPGACELSDVTKEQAAEAAPSEDDAFLAEQPCGEPLRPFENLASLPPDLDEAFEAFKLAIVHHKLSGWQEISLGDVLAVLDALKQLAQAPAEA